MQHKSCWQATVMNWWAIFSCDPSSVAGAMPWRGQSDNFRWGPGAGRMGRAGHWACTGPWPALWSGPSRTADGGLCELELRSLSSVSRSVRIKQLGFESSANHQASVAAGPTREIKTCSSRLKNRQCTICSDGLRVSDLCLPQMKQQKNRTWVNMVFLSLSCYLMFLLHCNLQQCTAILTWQHFFKHVTAVTPGSTGLLNCAFLSSYN